VLRAGPGGEEFKTFVNQFGLVDAWRRAWPVAREDRGPRRAFYSRIDYKLFSASIAPGVSADMEDRRSSSCHRVVRAPLLDRMGPQFSSGAPPFNELRQASNELRQR
jgi:hypothetical protein